MPPKLAVFAVSTVSVNGRGNGCGYGFISLWGDSQHRKRLVGGTPPTADAAGWAEAQTHFIDGGTSLMSTKKRRLSIKLTQGNWEKIHHKAEHAKKNLTDYVTHTCLGKEIVIITDLVEVHRELKAVGKNLNQVAMLAHSGKITAVNLGGMQSEMIAMNENLKEILERRRWSE